MTFALLAASLALSRPSPAATLAATDAPPLVEHPHIDLHPYLGYDEVYDSNIFLFPAPVSSWIHTYKAGLGAAARLGDKQTLAFTYDGSLRKYTRRAVPSLKDAFIQNVYGRYWYEAPSGFKIRAREYYLNTIDPASSELTGLLRRWQNSLGAEAGYEPDERPLHLTVDGQEDRYKYVSHADPFNQELDRYEQLWGLKAGWQLQPKTVAYAAYHRQLIHFTDFPSPSRDSKGHLLDFGVEGQLAPKTTGKAQVGLVSRHYDAAPAAGQGRNTTNFTALVSVVWKPIDRDRGELTLSRSLQESAFDINQFYIATNLGAAYYHQLMWGLLASVNAGTEWDKYPTTSFVGSNQPVNRRDYLYSGGAGLEYPVRDWLRVGASYEYRARFSPQLSGLFDYRDQITTLSLRATY